MEALVAGAEIKDVVLLADMLRQEFEKCHLDGVDVISITYANCLHSSLIAKPDAVLIFPSLKHSQNEQTISIYQKHLDDMLREFSKGTLLIRLSEGSPESFPAMVKLVASMLLAKKARRYQSLHQ